MRWRCKDTGPWLRDGKKETSRTVLQLQDWLDSTHSATCSFQALAAWDLQKCCLWSSSTCPTHQRWCFPGCTHLSMLQFAEADIVVVEKFSDMDNLTNERLAAASADGTPNTAEWFAFKSMPVNNYSIHVQIDVHVNVPRLLASRLLGFPAQWCHTTSKFLITLRNGWRIGPLRCWNVCIRP